MASKAESSIQKTLHLKLASSFVNLERVVEEAEAFMNTVSDDEDLCYRVTLLTSETVTNAMEHGNKWNPEKHILFDLTAYADHIEMRVFDEGEGFELSSVNDPLDQENLLNGRGRGLFFMEHMANELHREMDGCLLRLVFYRNAERSKT